jgi:hypothetical protein
MEMKVLLLVPKVAYDRLLLSCEKQDPKYQLLRNGLLETGSNGVQQVRILCDPDKAQTILELARKTSPDTFAAIRKIRNLPGQFSSD